MEEIKGDKCVKYWKVKIGRSKKQFEGRRGVGQKRLQERGGKRGGQRWEKKEGGAERGRSRTRLLHCSISSVCESLPPHPHPPQSLHLPHFLAIRGAAESAGARIQLCLSAVDLCAGCVCLCLPGARRCKLRAHGRVSGRHRRGTASTLSPLLTTHTLQEGVCARM